MPIDIVTDRRAWSGGDFSGKAEVTHTLGRRAVAALHEVVAPLLPRARDVAALSRAHFAHPDLAEALAPLYAEVRDGRGFVVIRGIPIDRYDLDGIKLLTWALGSCFGEAQSQSNLGDRIGEVTDVTALDPHARGYRSARELKLHTDICDMISLLSVRRARVGGQSALASAYTVHNLFMRERPDLLARLYEGYFYHRRGEEGPGEAPVTPHKVPVFSAAEGALSLRFVRPYMEYALKQEGRSDPELVEAFDLLERFAAQTRFAFDLDPGEALLFSNLTVLHARTAFEDWPEPERRRLLLRLWLNNPGFRPQRPELAVYGTGAGIPHVPGRTASFADFY